jgi:hypothetical protein
MSIISVSIISRLFWGWAGKFDCVCGDKTGSTRFGGTRPVEMEDVDVSVDDGEYGKSERM